MLKAVRTVLALRWGIALTERFFPPAVSQLGLRGDLVSRQRQARKMHQFVQVRGTHFRTVGDGVIVTQLHVDLLDRVDGQRAKSRPTELGD